MAIAEQGVGVSWRPVECSQPLVFTPANQPGGIMSAPVFGNTGEYWFSEANKNIARTLRLFFPRRLWTSAADPTDPGLVYGIHWRLGLILSAAAQTSITQNSYRLGSILQCGASPTDARIRVSPSIVYLTPEVPEFLSLQPPPPSNASAYLTLALIIATDQLQTCCLPVDLAIGQTWTA